jgi:drug/metabolite transporter (DMT)-like permease
VLTNQIVLMQALMPVAVFVVGCAFSTEKFSLGTFGNMIVVSIGVAIASYGALYFTPAQESQALHVCSEIPAASHISTMMSCEGHCIQSEVS